MKKVLLSLAAMLIAIAVNAAETATACFTVSPEMSCANCEKKIKENMRFEKGITAVETSLSSQTVTVKYNPAKTDSAKIIAGFKKIGYIATPANSPSRCDQKAACGKKKGCCQSRRTQCDTTKADCCK